METQRFDFRDNREPRSIIQAKLQEVAKLIRHGHLVGIPTETVYGLGANGLDEEAVNKIFQAKGRPQDNPLILHVASAQWLPLYCKEVPVTAYALARKFWPGPLTMILKRADCVPDVTTAGLDTVGVRCPDHAVTLNIIREAGVPIAAPSANVSGRPSCTSAEDVWEDMNGKITAIVDGGPCAVGVESTIIDLTCNPPRLLRPGGLPLEELEQALGTVVIDQGVTNAVGEGEQPKAPGMKYRHYAPKAQVTVVTGKGAQSAKVIKKHLKRGDGVICFEEFLPMFKGYEVQSLGLSTDKIAQAQRVFDALRAFDETEVTAIYAQCPDPKGLGLAVGNRLKKAAGFRVITPQKAPVILGLTGGTGSGKTSALGAIERLGGVVLDCDAIYHGLLETNQDLIGELQTAFPEAFGSEDHLNRKALGKIVFHNPLKLKTLNDITFPYMDAEIHRLIAPQDVPLYAIDAINLIESGLGALCQRTIAITSPVELRVQRIVKRDEIDRRYAYMRINAQKPDTYYRNRCDLELPNNVDSVQAFEEKAVAYFQTLILKIQEEQTHG